MLLNLLVAYTALMVMIAFVLIVYDLLELTADEHAADTFEGRNPGRKFFNKLLHDLEKTDAPTSTQRTSEVLLRELTTVPFPLRSYSDRSGRRIKRIDRVMSDLRAKLWPDKQ